MFELLVKSQIFYNIAYGLGGIGLLLAGIASLKVLIDWFKEYNERKKSNKLTADIKAKYPLVNLGKTFEIVQVTGTNPVYILDKNTKIRIWIDSPKRLIDLGYNVNLITYINKEELESYIEDKVFY